jgi:putative ABC transport system permease protein
VLKGRAFDARDTAGAPNVVIVSASLARTLWPDRDPIGQRLSIGFRGESFRDVIGVVGDVKHDALAGENVPALYCPYAQISETVRWLVTDMTFVLRTTGAPEALAPPLRTALAGIDHRLPLYSVTVMTRVVSRHIAAPRFYASLLGSFSLLAALLAAAGVYGVVAYSVGQRTHEIGVRMALGASLGAIRKDVVREGMTPVVVGAAVGLAAAYLVTGLLTRLLYHVSETDAGTFVAVPLALAAVALVACAIPARRAARIDPIVALRKE